MKAYPISYRKRGVEGRRIVLVNAESPESALELAKPMVRGGFGFCHVKDAHEVDAKARRRGRSE